MSTPQKNDARKTGTAPVATRGGGASTAAARSGGATNAAARHDAAPRRRGRPPKRVLAADRPGLGRENPTAELPATARTILAAARRVLAERGLEGLTIEAVAHEAQAGT
jgi:hypothetical protein